MDNKTLTAVEQEVDSSHIIEQECSIPVDDYDNDDADDQQRLGNFCQVFVKEELHDEEKAEEECSGNQDCSSVENEQEMPTSICSKDEPFICKFCDFTCARLRRKPRKNVQETRSAAQ
ncbi:uncharacterized protein LOC111060010 isoform X3 [Nilaparvata lugens]|uniref:uncharacterized protein LOC111060010 isoform X3 n=1 Tax=Nilaparvata lugens TaxID=108931 RepID=UPI00193EBA71|nr:uncharacterized protein LOC111060010 isoform X3 [Nilaparvata lugens]